MAHGLERSRLGAIIRSDVVDRDALLGTIEEAVRDLRDSLVTAVPRLEVQVRSPVVGEVLAETARGARRELGDVAAGDLWSESVLIRRRFDVSPRVASSQEGGVGGWGRDSPVVIDRRTEGVDAYAVRPDQMEGRTAETYSSNDLRAVYS